MRPLWVVEMQLGMRPAPVLADEDNGAPQEDLLSESAREYEARRCAICKANYPVFGFGPPLTRPGCSVWACARHRHGVEKMIAAGRLARGAIAQPSLF
jgi:hypothetical protein